MQPVKIGEKFYQSKGYIEAYVTVVDASQNTAGVTIRTCSVNGGTLFTGTVKPTKPSGYLQYHAFYVGKLEAWSTIPYEVFVPAGQGVYWSPENDRASIMMTYDMQP
ncbi:hypothetical protein ABE458_00575 [Pseudomonas protegens]|uniref:hypothetical protein n=1 Tax=Pseudomonas TaxID=286 RepID=UPI003207B020